jgi:DNA-binding FadR family transcriptional regulator
MKPGRMSVRKEIMAANNERALRGDTPPTGGGESRTFSRRSLHGQVAHDIGRQILGGLVKPGDLLPNETELSHRLGVSRTALREAIKVLAGKGLIESRPKTGTRVRPRANWNFLDPDVLAWASDGATAKHFTDELYELRRVIEPAAAAFAAERASRAELAQMEAGVARMAAAAAEDGRMNSGEIAFHNAILQASGNELFRSLGSVVEVALAISLQLSPPRHRRLQESLAQHRAVLDAVRRQDSAGAREAMKRLIDTSQRELRAALEQAQNLSEDS